MAASVDLDVGGDAAAAPGEGGVGDGERAVDGNPFRVVVVGLLGRHRAGGVDVHRAVVGDRHVVVDQDAGPGPDIQRRALLHREAGREGVVLVDRRGRADRHQGDRLPAVEAPAVEVDVVEALVGGQERHIGRRGGDGRVEDVVGQVAAVEHAAGDQGEVDPVEGAAGGGEVAASVDLDVGGDAAAAPGEGGVGDGERAVDGNPFRVVVVGLLGRHRAGGVDVHRAVIRDRHVVVDQDAGPGPDIQRRALLHREAGREGVVLVDRRGRADRHQGDRLPAVEAPAVEVDVVEALVGGQERHIGRRGRDGRVEDVVGQVAAVEHAAGDQGEVDPVEGAAGGGEVAAGVDLDVGGDAGAAPGEGGVGDGERAVDGNPFRVVVVGLLGRHRAGGVDVHRAVIRDRHVVVDQDAGPGPDIQRRALLHREAGREGVVLVDRRGRADRDQGDRLPAVEAPAVEGDVVEALVGGQERHIGRRGRDGRVEDVVGQVAAIEHAAVGQDE